jgi:hypothetical protein
MTKRPIQVEAAETLLRYRDHLIVPPDVLEQAHKALQEGAGQL